MQNHEKQGAHLKQRDEQLAAKSAVSRATAHLAKPGFPCRKRAAARAPTIYLKARAYWERRAAGRLVLLLVAGAIVHKIVFSPEFPLKTGWWRSSMRRGAGRVKIRLEHGCGSISKGRCRKLRARAWILLWRGGLVEASLRETCWKPTNQRAAPASNALGGK